MSTRNTFPLVHPATLPKHLLAGGAIALLLIGIFLAGTGDPDPEWGKFWFIRPLVIVPLAGMAGGFFYHLATNRYSAGWRKTLAVAVSLLVYVIGVWIGTVLGLDGTYWN